jgi:cytoskeletal protein CcmA (bactofilin family)
MQTGSGGRSLTAAIESRGGALDNILGVNTSFRGVLKTDGNIRVDGLYQGRIETAGNVLVGPGAKVLADIVAHTVQVWGIVRGQVIAHGRLEILSSGRVWGDVEVGSLHIDEGAVFAGRCLMSRDGKSTLIDADGRETDAPEAVGARSQAQLGLADGGDDRASLRDWQGIRTDPLGPTIADRDGTDG